MHIIHQLPIHACVFMFIHIMYTLIYSHWLIVWPWHVMGSWVAVRLNLGVKLRPTCSDFVWRDRVETALYVVHECFRQNGYLLSLMCIYGLLLLIMLQDVHIIETALFTCSLVLQ